MKYAVYIMSPETGTKSLFAVCKWFDEVERHRGLAKKTIKYGSVDWVSIKRWSIFD